MKSFYTIIYISDPQPNKVEPCTGQCFFQDEWESFEKDNINARLKKTKGRYNPNEFVTTLDDGSILRNEIPYEHTKNRYPWLCSLRDKDTRKKHHCGATLLR